MRGRKLQIILACLLQIKGIQDNTLKKEITEFLNNVRNSLKGDGKLAFIQRDAESFKMALANPIEPLR